MSYINIHFPPLTCECIEHIQLHPSVTTIIIAMRLDTFHYQRFLRYRYNLWRSLGYLPGIGLLGICHIGAWMLENGCRNFYSYVINKPKSGVPRRQEGEDAED